MNTKKNIFLLLLILGSIKTTSLHCMDTMFTMDDEEQKNTFENTTPESDVDTEVAQATKLEDRGPSIPRTSSKPISCTPRPTPDGEETAPFLGRRPPLVDSPRLMVGRKSTREEDLLRKTLLPAPSLDPMEAQEFNQIPALPIRPTFVHATEKPIQPISALTQELSSNSAAQNDFAFETLFNENQSSPSSQQEFPQMEMPQGVHKASFGSMGGSCSYSPYSSSLQSFSPPQKQIVLSEKFKQLLSEFYWMIGFATAKKRFFSDPATHDHLFAKVKASAKVFEREQNSRFLNRQTFSLFEQEILHKIHPVFIAIATNLSKHFSLTSDDLNGIDYLPLFDQKQIMTEFMKWCDQENVELTDLKRELRDKILAKGFGLIDDAQHSPQEYMPTLRRQKNTLESY